MNAPSKKPVGTETVADVLAEMDAKRAANMHIWNVLSKTDPKHTKGFQRAGGFKGTAIKPIWITQRLTELFGPCGTGWGMGKPEFQTVIAADGEVLVYCTVEGWYSVDDGKVAVVYGVGGDKCIAKQTNRMFVDDEAFKKAFTDALGNAFKFVGVGADVHMGLFDDSKYLAEVTAEFHPKPDNPKTGETGERIRTNEPEAREKLDGPHTSKTALKAAVAKIVRQVEACESVDAIETVKADNKRTINQARRDWPELIDGDPNCGEDIGLKGTLAKRRTELEHTLEYQLLVSTLNECTSGNEYQGWLAKNGDVIDSLDGAESRAFEAIHEEKAEALKLVDTASVG